MYSVVEKLPSKIHSRYRRFRIKKMIKPFCQKGTNNDIVHCGNDEYGGFFVVDDKINGGVVLSFGIGEDLSFSKDLIEKFNCDVYAFDPTPKSAAYVQSHELWNNRKFHFFEIGLSDSDGKEIFFLPRNDEFVSGATNYRKDLNSEGIEVMFKCLSSIMQDLKLERFTILKLDIEGTEFQVFEKISIDEMRFDQLCIEIHDRFFKDGYSKFDKFLRKVFAAGFRIVKVSSTFEEFTFLRMGK